MKFTKDSKVQRRMVACLDGAGGWFSQSYEFFAEDGTNLNVFMSVSGSRKEPTTKAFSCAEGGGQHYATLIDALEAAGHDVTELRA